MENSRYEHDSSRVREPSGGNGEAEVSERTVEVYSAKRAGSDHSWEYSESHKTGDGKRGRVDPDTGSDAFTIETEGSEDGADGSRRKERVRLERDPSVPERLKRKGKDAAREGQGRWKSAHLSLLSGLQLDVQDFADRWLFRIRDLMSDPLGPHGSLRQRGPSQLVSEAEEELKKLEICRKWGRPISFLKLEIEGKGTERKEEEAPAGPPPAEKSDKGSATKIWGLILIALCLLVFESFWNVGLLLSALEGGAVEAFMLALLLSFVNVGAVGIGLGTLLQFLQRKIGQTKRGLYHAAWGGWIVLMLGFNMIMGRHREAYGRVAEEITANPTGVRPTPGSFLPEISWIPINWDLQALAFCLVGIAVCAAGCVKGFTFMRKLRGDEPKDVELQRSGVGSVSQVDFEGKIKLEANNADNESQIFDTFMSLPQRYGRRLAHELRNQVAGWYQKLDRERREVQTKIDWLNNEQNWQALVDTAEHAFVAAHNANYPEKIDREQVAAHRQEKYPNPLTKPTSDAEILRDAAEAVEGWKKEGRDEFDDRLESAFAKVTEVWKRYKPLILGPPKQDNF